MSIDYDRMFFGEMVKELRLYTAGVGLRKFAEIMEMDAAALSDIEHGYAPPPEDAEWFWKLVYALEIQSDIMAQLQLRRAVEGPFVMQKMPENIIPLFACGEDKRPITIEKYTKMCEWLNNNALEHNKKADEYNSKNRSDQ